MADKAPADLKTTIITNDDLEIAIATDDHTERPNALSKATPENLQKLDEIRKLSWFDRTFRRMDSGSLRGVIIMWIRMTLGIGILTLPYYVKQFGAVTGVAVIAIAALLNIFTYRFIFEASFYTDKKNYSDLIEELLGKNTLAVFKWTFLMDIVSTMMVYCIVSWSLFEYILYFLQIGGDQLNTWIVNMDKLEFDEYHPSMVKIRAGFFAAVFVLTIPLFLKKNLESLQKVTIGYLFALFLLVFIILSEVPFFKHARRNEDIQFHPFKKPELGWIEAFFGLCMSFYVQPFIFSLRGELLLPSLKRTKKIAKTSVSIEAVIFIVLGVAGYFALGDKYTTDMLILRKPYDGKNEISETIFRVTIAIFFLLNTLGLAMYNPSLREYLYPYINIKSERVKFAVVSLVPFFIICFVAFAYPYITNVIGFFSVTVYNFNGYIIPIMMKIKILKLKSEPLYKRATAYGVLALFILLGIVGFAVSIYKKVYKEEEE